jgi:glycosyltransferase involved in cell wall biosynthesis
MKTVLMVAYYFPPVGGLAAAGSQRALRFARHLPASGWRPVILTARESSYESYLSMDPDLAAAVPEAMTVIRTGVWRGLTPLLHLKALVGRLRPGQGPTAPLSGAASEGPMAPRDKRGWYGNLKDAITDLFEIPDEQVGWLAPAVRAGIRSIRRYEVDVIYATGRPWTALVVGVVLKRLTGKPLVVDFRDPWMTNPFRLSYSPFRNRVEAALEARVVANADVLVANTEHLRAEFAARFSDFALQRFVTIPNGFDPDEFAAIKPMDRGDSTETVRLTHTGFLYGKRDPRSLLEAIKLVHDRGIVRPGQLTCELVGPVQLPYDLGAYVRERGLERFVLQRGQVTHVESLAALAACDAALLLQPGTDTQIPSKLFEYIGMDKRVLAIAQKESAVARIVREHALGEVADAEDVESIARAIECTIHACHVRGAGQVIAPEIKARFDVRCLVRELGDTMTRLVA